MSKDHFVPRFIIERFTNPDGKLHFYNKVSNSISLEVPHYTQLQKENFHSKENLSKLKKIFKHIEINPIFNNSEDKLEHALDSCLEFPMGVIVSKIIRGFNDKKEIVLTPKEETFIKEYAAIQHLRTLKFKMLTKEFNEKFKFPPDLKDQIIDGESNREINIKEIIKKHNPSLNYKGRRKLELKWRKKVKKNPSLIEDIRKKIFGESLDNLVKKAKQDIKNILNHLDRHSADIIDIKKRNSFFKRCDLNNRNVVIVINQTETPFVLGDTGIIIMADDPEGKKNLDIFLPIHPNLLIGLSNELPKNAVINEEFVVNFNEISKQESYKNIYSDSEGILKQFID